MTRLIKIVVGVTSAGASLIASSLAQGSSCASDSVDFTLQALSGLEGQTFSAVELNDAGQVAGRILPSTPGGAQQAFVWQAGVLKTRSFPGATVSVEGLSDGGLVVGRLFSAGVGQTYVWDSETDNVTLVSTSLEHFAADVDDGRTVVGIDGDGLFGFAMDADTGKFETIAFGAPPEAGVGTSGAASINGAGVAVGGEVVFIEDPGFYMELPYRWTALGGIEQLAVVPGGFGGRATDVAPGGDMCGTVFDEFFAHHAGLWTDDGATLTNLGSPFGYFVSDALAVNDFEQVVVVAPNDLFGFTRGFLWQNGAYHDLSCFTPSGLFVTRPVDINDQGQILVQLTNSGGQQIVGYGLLVPAQPPVAALESQRLGVPPNAAALLPGVTSEPILGSLWDPVVDHAVFLPGATADFALLAIAPTNLPLAGLGTLLCDPATVFQTVPAAPGVPFQIPIPSDPVLLGASVCTQAASVAGVEVGLTNALDLTLGNL